jgi:DNA-directed RNA polymerases I, II, and III subunit RPABC1
MPFLREYLEMMYHIHSNVHEMLHDRYYHHIISGKQLECFDDFLKEFVKLGTLDKEAMTFVRMNKVKTISPRFISVFFTREETIGKKSIEKLLESMAKNKINHCILVYPKIITSSARKRVEKCRKIEIFSEEDLVVNVTKHQMMPLFRIMSDAEKKRFFLYTKLSEDRLPRISVNDPVAKYYGMNRGDLIKIVRTSDTAGKYVTFRVCH